MTFIHLLSDDRTWFRRWFEFWTIDHRSGADSFDAVGLAGATRVGRQFADGYGTNLLMAGGGHAVHSNALIDDGVIAPDDIVVDHGRLVIDGADPRGRQGMEM